VQLGIADLLFSLKTWLRAQADMGLAEPARSFPFLNSPSQFRLPFHLVSKKQRFAAVNIVHALM
jgi:hypothetical protein